MKRRTARCCCGAVTITVEGEPERVIRCHCDYCQRRTGSVLQVSAWFFEDQIVERTGETRVYNESPDNVGVDFTFCAVCGSTVYWPIRALGGITGIAVGCFADPDFPPPTQEYWDSKRHSWVPPLADADSFAEFPPPARMLPRRSDDD